MPPASPDSVACAHTLILSVPDLTDPAAVEDLARKVRAECVTLDVLVNGTLVARGEVVVVNDKYGIRLTDVVSPAERIKRFQ